MAQHAGSHQRRNRCDPFPVLKRPARHPEVERDRPRQQGRVHQPEPGPSEAHRPERPPCGAVDDEIGEADQNQRQPPQQHAVGVDRTKPPERQRGRRQELRRPELDREHDPVDRRNDQPDRAGQNCDMNQANGPVGGTGICCRRVHLAPRALHVDCL